MKPENNRILALVMCCVFVFASVFSFVYIVKEGDHDCIGGNCPICACIHFAEQMLKTIWGGAITLGAVACAYVILLLSFPNGGSLPQRGTPVTEKTRMNN